MANRMVSLIAAALLVMVPGLGSSQEFNSTLSEDVAVWADKLFADAAQNKRYSGAVVAFVEGGELTFSKGYGYADYQRKTPIVPSQTAFRIGSNSKTFTATAIAQLMERGLIDSIDDPANKYLKRLQLPSPDGVEITLRQLMTHTTGFENRVFHIATDKHLDLPLSAEEIAKYKSEVINPPGTYNSYNNYATTIPGLIVEDLTGIPIADYIDQHIFKPLGMNHSIMNMSPDPSEGLGVSYGFLPNGEASLIPHRTIHPFFAPVGGINASAEDMGRYMIAHLGGEQASDQLKVSQQALDFMHSRLSGNHPNSSGFGLIWFVMDWNGHQVVLHGGDWPGTHSGMLLFPEENAGLFFALMAESPEVPLLESITGSERLTPIPGVEVLPPISNIGVLSNYLTARYGPLQPPVSESQEVMPPLDDFVGSYAAQSAPFSTMERLLKFVDDMAVVEVQLNADDTLNIYGKGPYQQVAPDVFWADSVTMPLSGLFLDSSLFNFIRNEQGDVVALTPMIGFDAWEKIGLGQDPRFHLQAWLFITVLGLTGLLIAFYPRTTPALTKWLPSVNGLLLIALPLILILGYPEGEAMIDGVFFGYTGRYTLFAVVGHMAAIVALLMVWRGVKMWFDGTWAGSLWGYVFRIHYALLALAGLVFIGVLRFSNVLVV